MNKQDYNAGVRKGERLTIDYFKKLRNTNSATTTCNLFEKYIKKRLKKIRRKR